MWPKKLFPAINGEMQNQEQCSQVQSDETGFRQHFDSDGWVIAGASGL